MNIDWAGLIARKYDIMQQQADTQRTGVTAAANLDTVRAGLLPAESASEIAYRRAQADLAGANAANVDETTKFVGPLARANIGLMGANAKESGARAGLLSEQALGERQLSSIFGSGLNFRFGTSGGSALDALRSQPLRF